LRQVREQLTTFRERAIVAEQEQKRLQDELSCLSKQKDGICEDLQKVQKQILQKNMGKIENIGEEKLKINYENSKFREFHFSIL
jgi:hypothetical protein